MEREHFEYMAAQIANETPQDSESRDTAIGFAMCLAAKFGNRFDELTLYARIAQYDCGMQDAATYLNNH